MNTQRTRRGLSALRMLTIALISVAGLGTTDPRFAAAQADESGVEDSTYTGPNFGWSVEWDEDDWEFSSEDNSGGADIVSLQTVDEDLFALANFFAGVNFEGDASDCVAGWEDLIADRDGVSDVEEDHSFDLPDGLSDGESTTYVYVSETEDGDEFDLIEYVTCQTLVEDEAVLIMTVITVPAVFEDLIPLVDDLTAEVTLPDESDGGNAIDDEDDTQSSNDDEDDTDTQDSDDDASTEDADDGSSGTDDEESSTDDEDSTSTDDEDSTSTDDGEATTDDDDGDTDDESGVDGNEFVGPNFGWSLTWDEDVWTFDSEDNSAGSDFMSLLSEDPFGVVLIQGIESFEGDPDTCAESWGDVIVDRGDAEEVEEVRGVELPDAPRPASDAAYTYPLELESGDEVQIIEYIQCYELVEDEAVLEVILQVTEDDLEDMIPLFDELVAEIELP